MAYEAAANSGDNPDGSHRRLESWKEIAVYLGRDVRTVQRWERRDRLPVHRLHHSKLGSVFAYTSELDAWREARDRCLANQRTDAATRQAPTIPRRVWFALTVAAPTVVLVAGLAVVLLGRLADVTGAGSRIRAVAVLPLVDLSGNEEQAYFADGMTEALIGRLSAVRDLRVISRTSVMPFKEARKSVQDIARVLNVEAVVEGSVLRSDDRVRISAHLVRADTQENVWSGTYDRELRDVLTLQSEVAEAIAREIQVSVAGPAESTRVIRPRSIAPEAYESYLKGRFYLNKRNRTPADAEESVRLFEHAIARDVMFAPAHAGLAAAYQALGATSTGVLPVVETISKAVAAARRALELDPQLGEAHVMLARADQQAWHWAAAEAGYRRAIDIDANDATAHSAYGELLTWLGRTEEGVLFSRRGREFDPLSVDKTVRLAWVLYHARQYNEAIRELRTVLAAEPDHATALWFLGFALIEVSRFDEAIQTLARAAEVWGRNPAALGVLARAYGRDGRRTEALRIIDELKQRERVGYVAPAVFVNAYVGVGDRDRVFAALERAYREHSNIMQFLKTHPLYDPVRNDPRFGELLRRVGLA